MIVVGVTGNLSSGKTAVAKIFKSLGAVVFDADRAAARALEKGRPTARAAVKIFGKEYLGAGGWIDRGKLARHVFGHPRDLKKLNILIHPGVIFECLKLIEKNRAKKGMLVLDVPLLFESKMENIADVTVVVRAPVRRLLARSRRKGIGRALARKILSTQWPGERKARLADFIIDNDGTRRSLEKKVREVFGEIIKRN
ncbi:MAG: dephospho-CoA kinase [Candidatus Omnitrophica bacterium]|nr:dephospho-CoA kinase [Candidatus Omnitrophota bacterium]